jgi:hypothetical protein
MQGIFGGRSFFFKEGVSVPVLEYTAPRIEARKIVLEGVMADHSCWPSIKGDVNYVEYDNVYDDLETPAGKDIVVF